MAATKEDVNRWMHSGKMRGATHVVSVCDTFDYDDYPVYVYSHQNVDDVVKEYNKRSMQRVNEVITL